MSDSTTNENNSSNAATEKARPNFERRAPRDFQIVSALNSPEDINTFYDSYADSMQIQMAEAYISAFEGPPWFEVGMYDRADLVQNYFPQSLLASLPGIICLNYSIYGDENLMLSGACFGGERSLAELVTNKYKGDAQILDRMLEITGIKEDQKFFYDNENFLRNEFQGRKVGSAMNKAYFEAIEKSGVNNFLWRTINLPWGQLKARQAVNLGYDVKVFAVPDNFQVNGVPTSRLVYFCSKSSDKSNSRIIDLTEQL